MPNAEYQRLTRSRSRGGFAVAAVTRTSLWLGADHLLVINSNGYTETYKRFYFRDIQAITTQQTNRWKIWSVVWIGLFAVCALVLIVGLFEVAHRPMQSDDFIGFFGWGIPAAFFFIGFLINYFRGPTALVQLRTAVQTETLPSLGRVRQTRKVLEKVLPLILAAQGQLSAAEISAGLSAAIPPTSPQSEHVPPVMS